MTGRVFVNEASTVLVTTWEDADGVITVTVATRAHKGDTWGPPVTCTEITDG